MRADYRATGRKTQNRKKTPRLNKGEKDVNPKQGQSVFCVLRAKTSQLQSTKSSGGNGLGGGNDEERTRKKKKNVEKPSI